MIWQDNEERLKGNPGGRLICSALVLLTCFLADSALAALPLQTSVTKDGITWTVDHPAPVGQLINGDYYVIGPVTVTAIDPPPTTSSQHKRLDGVAAYRRKKTFL